MDSFLNSCRRHARVCLLTALIFTFFAGAVLAQRSSFTSFSSSKDLPQSQILSIAQDMKGYMWFGTYSGAVSFNGYRWDTLDSSNGLLNNSVWDITVGADGRLYFATFGGVAIMDKGNFSYLTIEDGLSSNSIFDLYFDADGTLWISTDSNLCRYSNGEVQIFGQEQGIPEAQVRRVYRDKNGVLWVGTAVGLYRQDGSGFTNVPLGIGIENSQVNEFCEGADGSLLICSNSGLLRKTQNGFEDYGERWGIGRVRITKALYDSEGALWVATRYGTYRILDGKSDHFTTDDGLSRDNIIYMYRDREGSIWFGTDYGISKHSLSSFAYYNKEDGLPSDQVFDIDFDSKGRIWAATENGIAVLSPDMELQFIIDAKDGLEGYVVSSVVRGLDDSMYIGTQQGFFIWDGQRVNKLLDNTFVLQMAVSRTGRVWIPSRTGVYWFDPGKTDAVQKFPSGHPLADMFTNCIAEDSTGRIWVGTLGHGIYILEGMEATRLEGTEKLNKQDIWTIAPDPGGGVWFGTNGEGLFRYLDGNLTQITTEDGLFNNFVWQILPDENGSVWIGTNLGIDQYDGTHFTHFDMNDGLASNEGFASACAMDRRGRLWFGSGKGLSMTRKDLSVVRSEEVPVIVEKVTVGERIFPFPTTLDLNPNENTLRIQFAALFLRNERALEYRYRLENADANWSTPDYVHEVRYGKLPPGSYNFHVEATTDNGRTWSALATPLSIFIATPFYQTPVFIGLMALLVVASCVGAFRFYANRERRNRQRLEKLIAKRTKELALANENLVRANEDLQRSNSDLQAFSSSVSHDLRAPLNRIIGYAQLMENDPEKSSEKQFDEYLQRIIRDSRRMGSLIQDLLKLSTARRTEIKKETCNLSRICSEIFSELEKSDVDRNVILQMESDLIVEGDPSLLRIAMENLIGNAWKFTVETERAVVRIYCEDHEDERVVKIEDNGIGFDQEKADKLFQYFGRLHSSQQFQGLGIGLVTVKRIIERHGGRVWAEGTQGKGAKFYFSMRKEKQNQESANTRAELEHMVHIPTK